MPVLHQLSFTAIRSERDQMRPVVPTGCATASEIPDPGLQDYRLKGEYKAGESPLFQAHFHYFRLTARMPDPDARPGAPGETLETLIHPAIKTGRVLISAN